MKPATFDYYRPTSVAGAVEALAESPFAKVLAGGQSLIPSMNFRLSTPSMLVDIGRLSELNGIEVTAESVTIGAAVTQYEVESSAEVAAVAPALGEALRWIGHRQIRNRGTVCGSLAHADPAAELPALAVATDAVFTVVGSGGTRTVGARQFLRGPFWTDLAPGEMITKVRFPAAGANTKTRVEEIARRSGDFALVGVVVRIDRSDGQVEQATLTGFGVGGTPDRLTAAEDVVQRVGPLDERKRMDLYDAVYADAEGAVDDIHASGEYRREALASLVIRTVAELTGAGSEEGGRA